MINVLAFNLSSVCVGVVASRVNEITKTPIKVISCPVIPSKFDVTRLGYKRSKAKIKTRGGEYINSYIKEGEKEITKQEKKRRDIEVRNNSNLHALSYISTQIEKIVTMIKPNVVLVEKNKIFNGVLTGMDWIVNNIFSDTDTFCLMLLLRMRNIYVPLALAFLCFLF